MPISKNIVANIEIQMSLSSMIELIVVVSIVVVSKLKPVSFESFFNTSNLEEQSKGQGGSVITKSCGVQLTKSGSNKYNCASVFQIKIISIFNI